MVTHLHGWAYKAGHLLADASTAFAVLAVVTGTIVTVIVVPRGTATIRMPGNGRLHVMPMECAGVAPGFVAVCFTTLYEENQ